MRVPWRRRKKKDSPSMSKDEVMCPSCGVRPAYPIDPFCKKYCHPTAVVSTAQQTNAVMRQQALELQNQFAQYQQIIARQTQGFGSGTLQPGQIFPVNVPPQLGQWTTTTITTARQPKMRQQALAETVVGPILAYRAWEVEDGPLGYELHSITANAHWLPGVVMEGDISSHGIYAYREASWATTSFSRGYLFGGVWLWGDVIEHDHGYRASHAYPAFFFLEEKRLEPNWQNLSEPVPELSLAKAFDVPLLLVDSLNNLPVREGLRERLLFGPDEKPLPERP